MRILLIAANYPPHVIGGWEQLLEDIAVRLAERGHKMAVLTSHYGLPKPESFHVDSGSVNRVLELESDVQNYRPSSLLSAHRRLKWNLAQTETAIRAFKPDMVFVNNLWNLSRGIPWVAEQIMPGRVVYYMASPWAYPPDTREGYWRDRGHNPVGRIFKGVVGPYALRTIAREHDRFRLSFDHVLCVSEASRAAVARELGRDPAALRVVHNGVELDQFYPRSDWEENFNRSELSLLFAGTLGHHKGTHTAIEALTRLGNTNRPVTLTIVGSGNDEYEAQLRRMVAEAGLDGRVTFHGRVPREEMPELMRRFDVFLLPSIWDEPLARVMQEAMASGLLVIGTNTGGTGEALVDGSTGLVFPPGDAGALAACIQSALDDPAGARNLAENGRRLVVEHFSLDRMVDEIEEYFSTVVAVAKHPVR